MSFAVNLLSQFGITWKLQFQIFIFPFKLAKIDQMSHCRSSMGAVLNVLYEVSNRRNIDQLFSRETLTHGLFSSLKCLIVRFMILVVSGLPIIILDRHALIANMERSLEHLIWGFPGWLNIKWISSWISFVSKDVDLLSGIETTLHFFPGGISSSTVSLNPFASKMGRLFITVSSSIAVRSRERGLQKFG